MHNIRFHGLGLNKREIYFLCVFFFEKHTVSRSLIVSEDNMREQFKTKFLAKVIEHGMGQELSSSQAVIRQTQYFAKKWVIWTGKVKTIQHETLGRFQLRNAKFP